MKKILKKVISLIVLSSFLIVPTVFASAAVISAQAATEVIEALDIAERVDYPYFKKTYTRIEFAKMLCKMDIEYPISENLPDYVKDVSSKNVDYARFVIGKGYMELDDNGNFNPNGDISYLSAAKALAGVAGYSILAEIKGGAEADHMHAAQRAGILKGVKVQNTEKLSREELALLILNTLDAEPLDLNVSGVQMTTGSLLEKREIYRYEGVLLATRNRSIGAALTKSGKVNIDGYVFDAETDVADYLVGKKVIYYLREENGVNTVVCVVDATGETTLKIYAKDIDDYKFGSSELTIYYGDNERVKVPFSAMVMVNGKPGDLTPQLMAALNTGHLEIFDADGDGNIDTVYAVACVSDVAISASGDTHMIKMQHQAINYDRISDHVVFYENGKITTVDSIRNGSVVSIAADAYSFANGVLSNDYAAADHLEVYISNKKATGILDSISDHSYSVDGRSYDLSKYLTDVAIPSNESLVVGNSYVFYIDYYGLICDYESDVNANGMKYGYFIKGEIKSGGLDSNLRIRILTQEGVIQNFDVAKKYRLDGATKENTDDSVLTDTLYMRQVIRYRVKDGLIAALDTDPLRHETARKLPSGVSGAFDYTSPASAAVFGPGETAENSLTTDWGRTYKNQTYRGNMTGFDSYKTMVTNNTVVFKVPDPYDASGNYITAVNENEIFAADMSTFISSTTYDISSYDIGDFGATGCIVMYGGSADSVGRFRPLNIFEKAVVALDSDGNYIYRLTLHGANGSSTIDTVDMDEIRFENSSGAEISADFIPTLVKGDLVRFETNALNKITRIRYDFSVINGENTMAAEVPNSSDLVQIGHYYLHASDKNHFEFTKNSDMTELFAHSFKYAKGVPVYNMVDGTLKTYTGNFDELPTYVNDANRVTIVLHLTYYELVSAVIYVWD